VSSPKDIEVPKSKAAAKAARSKTIEVPKSLRPKAAPTAKAKAGARPKTAEVPAAPPPVTDETLLAETSLQEIERLAAESVAFHRHQQDEIVHAQAVAVAAARRQIPLDPAQLKARNRRNLGIALALIAFVVLVFITTIVRLGGGAVPHS
jgi:hypothetical protein